jgi:hypothetical protein
MRGALARVFILLSIALAIANAQCFTRCLVELPDNAPPPCHSHGKTQVLPPQHDLRPTAAPTVQAAGSLAPVPVGQFAAAPFTDIGELRPPPLAITTAPLPLRI